MSGIPEEWVMSNFENISSYIQRGKGPKYSSEKNDFPVVNQKAIRWFGIQSIHLKYVAESQWEKWDENRYIRVGDILWNSTGTGTIGRACFVDKNEVVKAKVVDSHVTIIRTRLEDKYVFYWIMHPSTQEKINGLYTGTTNQVELSKSLIQSINIPLPPLSEQKEIVSRLDLLLGQVEKIKARIDGIPAILKSFRQSVLAAAVSGKLTEEWRGTRELGGWEDFSIEEIALPIKYSLGIGPFGSNLKVVDYREEGHPLVFVREIRANAFGDDNTKFVNNEKFSELKAHRVLPGDILITKMGDPPGDVAIYPESRPEGIITADCIKLTVNEEIARREYIAFAMQSHQFRNSVIEISAGVAQKKVNLKSFKKLILPLPKAEEQDEIISNVQDLFNLADSIEKKIQAAQERVDNLTQSILAKAFRGELTQEWREENLELISGENSAEALLEQIKKERKTTAPIKKKASRRKIMIKKKGIIDILNENPTGISVEQLFSESRFDDISDFYSELKKLRPSLEEKKSLKGWPNEKKVFISLIKDRS